LGVLFLELVREYLSQSGTQEPPVERRTLGWLASYLSTHLGEPISVGDMAEQAGLSVSRFQVVFRESFGIPPARYLLELRVRHAGELLQATSWTLSHIAGLCGFSDVHHFAKTFRRLTGLTPGEHRRSGERRLSLRPGHLDFE
jgi:transcriptional regulator GlxA family with amidase domain